MYHTPVLKKTCMHWKHTTQPNRVSTVAQMATDIMLHGEKKNEVDCGQFSCVHTMFTVSWLQVSKSVKSAT